MALALVGITALLGAAGLTSYFIKLETEGRRHVVVRILLALLLLEMVVQPDAFRTPIGLFRLPLGPFDARPADIVIPLALIARTLTSKVPRYVSAPVLMWFCFIVWYSTAGPIGYSGGHSVPMVIAQLRGPLVGVCVMIIVAGVDVNKLLGGDWLPRVGRAVGIVGAILVFTHFAELSLTLDAPIIGFRALGALGADARTMFPILGVMAIVAEVSGGRRRLMVVLPALALVAAPIAETQGGPYLAVLVLLLLLTLVALGSTWRRRVQLTAVDVGFVFSLFLIVGAVSVFASGGASPAFVDQFEEAVLSDTQATTTNERFQLWSEATDVITASPITGAGLGVQGTIERKFPAPEVTTAFHNVLFDIAARSGVVGLGFFLLALVMTVRSAARVWERHEDSVIAGLAMTSMLGAFAILGRALVSSSFEHTRVTVGLFLLIGLVLASEKTLYSSPSDDGMERRTRPAGQSR